jgi:hypothetical protein
MDARDRRATPRAHWALLGVLTILMMLFLLLSGLVNGQAGESAQNPSSRALPGQVPEALHGGGPIVTRLILRRLAVASQTGTSS